MMLNWIVRVWDDPLGNPKTRSELLKQLAQQSPRVALDRISTYLSDLLKASDLDPISLLRIVYPLDKAGTTYERQLTREYLSLDAQPELPQQQAIANSVAIYAERLISLYRLCLAQHRIGGAGAVALRNQLSRIICKALRAYSMQLKWSLFHYRPVELGFWRELGDLYRLADSLHFAQTNVVIHRGETTTVQAEFLRASMMAASSPDSLQPRQVEVVDSILARFCGDFQLAQRPTEGLPFVVDLSGQTTPRRLSQQAKFTSVKRCFGPGPAYERVREAEEFIERSNMVPTGLGLSSEAVDPPLVQTTVQHLLNCWLPQLAQRHQVRRLHVERVTVVHEFEEVVANMASLLLDTPFRQQRRAMGIGRRQPDRLWRLRAQSGGSLDQRRSSDRAQARRRRIVECRYRQASLDGRARQPLRGRRNARAGRSSRHHRGRTGRRQAASGCERGSLHTVARRRCDDARSTPVDAGRSLRALRAIDHAGLR